MVESPLTSVSMTVQVCVIPMADCNLGCSGMDKVVTTALYMAA